MDNYTLNGSTLRVSQTSVAESLFLLEEKNRRCLFFEYSHAWEISIDHRVDRK